MATHSSILAWKIPGMGEYGGLPSMGLHRVGHDWSDLAAAAAGCQDEWTGGSSKKLASTGGEGMSRLWCYPKYHFSHKHWARYPKQLCHSHGVSPQSQTRVTLQFTWLMSVFPTNLRTLGDTHPQDGRSSRAGWPQADSPAADDHSSYVRPASCE